MGKNPQKMKSGDIRMSHHHRDHCRREEERYRRERCGREEDGRREHGRESMYLAYPMNPACTAPMHGMCFMTPRGPVCTMRPADGMDGRCPRR
jgi:hypothetical protein